MIIYKWDRDRYDCYFNKTKVASLIYDIETEKSQKTNPFYRRMWYIHSLNKKLKNKRSENLDTLKQFIENEYK